jgi:predicted transposase/invertase (TIGR01784 family)
MTVQNAHDRFFRRTLGERELAISFLQHYLPADVMPLLDLSTLVVTDTSLVDEALAEHQNDLLYEVQTRTGEGVLVYVLLEHKSYPDKWVLLQLLRYMVKLWQQEAEGQGNTAVLRPILPILVYHGEVVWPFTLDFQGYFAELGVLQKYVPQFTAVLRDFSARSPEEIRGDLNLQAVLLALRRILDRNLRQEFEGFISYVFQLHQDENGLRLLRLILYYFVIATHKVDRAELERVLALQGTEGEEIMQTIAMEYIREGIAKGEQIGLQRGEQIGLQRGEQIGLQEAIANILTARFGTPAPWLMQKLEAETELTILRQAVSQATLAPTLDAFGIWFSSVTTQP